MGGVGVTFAGNSKALADNILERQPFISCVRTSCRAMQRSIIQRISGLWILIVTAAPLGLGQEWNCIQVLNNGTATLNWQSDANMLRFVSDATTKSEFETPQLFGLQSPHPCLGMEYR